MTRNIGLSTSPRSTPSTRCGTHAKRPRSSRRAPVQKTGGGGGSSPAGVEYALAMLSRRTSKSDWLPFSDLAASERASGALPSYHPWEGAPDVRAAQPSTQHGMCHSSPPHLSCQTGLAQTTVTLVRPVYCVLGTVEHRGRDVAAENSVRPPVSPAAGRSAGRAGTAGQPSEAPRRPFPAPVGVFSARTCVCRT